MNINNIPTHVITWGKWIEESLNDVKELVICITGNPGLPGFYTEFGGALQGELGADGHNLPVWVIGECVSCLYFMYSSLALTFAQVTLGMTIRPRRAYAKCRSSPETRSSLIWTVK